MKRWNQTVTALCLAVGMALAAITLLPSADTGSLSRWTEGETYQFVLSNGDTLTGKVLTFNSNGIQIEAPDAVGKYHSLGEKFYLNEDQVMAWSRKW